MKKVFVFLFIFPLIIFSSCSDDDDVYISSPIVGTWVCNNFGYSININYNGATQERITELRNKAVDVVYPYIDETTTYTFKTNGILAIEKDAKVEEVVYRIEGDRIVTKFGSSKSKFNILAEENFVHLDVDITKFMADLFKTEYPVSTIVEMELKIDAKRVE